MVWVMGKITTLAVFMLFCLASVRCVQGGVILGDSPVVINGCSAAMAADSMAAQKEQQQRSNIRQLESFAIFGSSIMTGQTVSPSAAVWEIEILLPQPTPSSFLTLANAILPASPVINGLLKPS